MSPSPLPHSSSPLPQPALHRRRRPVGEGRARGWAVTAAAWLATGMALASAAALTGCGLTLRGGLATLDHAFRGESAALDAQARDPNALDPALRYLKVQAGRRTGLMVLGGAAVTGHGPTETWYSADGAVLRLAAGRLVGYADLQRAWSVVPPAPAAAPVDWLAAASGTAPGPRVWHETDTQPGYRLARRAARERVALNAPPAGSQAQGLAPDVRWFVERDAIGGGAPAWYAVDVSTAPGRVVHGQACVDAGLCLSWQPWPAAATPAQAVP